MIHVKVEDTNINEFNGVSKTTGKPFHIRKQEAWAILPGQKKERPFFIQLEDGQEPYQPGTYVLDPSCFYIDRYDSLSLGRIKLIQKSAVKAV